MKHLRLIRHLIVVMFVIAALLSPAAGLVAVADNATPVADSGSSAESTPPPADESDDAGAITPPSQTPTQSPAADPTSAPADDAADQPPATEEESSGDAINAEPPVEEPAPEGDAAPTAEAPAPADEKTSESAEPNAAPVAGDDSFTVETDAILTVNAPGLLGNDSDPNDDALVVAGVEGPLPANGTIEANTLKADGSFRYRSRPGFVGTDTFNYTVSDSNLTDVGTVTITVKAPNKPPTAVNDSFSVAKNTALTVDAPGILANDTDPNGEALSAVLSSLLGPDHGMLDTNADGSFTYTPETDFVGDDSFTYVASDGTANSNVGTVTIEVTNTPPVVEHDTYSIAKDTHLAVDAASGALANDFDPDGDPLGDAALMFTGPPAHGTLDGDTIAPDGSFVYTPNPGFVGTDSFNYGVCDPFVCNFATVTILVIDPALNTPPVAVEDSYTTPQNTALTVDVEHGLLVNDFDAEGEPITAGLFFAGAPAHGTLDGDTIAPDGSFVYTPNPGFVGTDTIIYGVSDCCVVGNFVTVTITVTGPNQPPVANDDRYTTPQDTTLITDGATGLLANDSDPDGDALTFDTFSGPAHGTTIFGSNGAITYTPEQGFVGSDSFTYRASDGKALSNLATVTIEVTAAPAPAPNQPPTGLADKYRVAWDTPLTVNAAKGVLANDSDPNGDKLTAKLEAGPAHGTLTLNADGSFTYTPAKGFRGKDKFTYRPFDGTASGNLVTVQLTLNKAASQASTADTATSPDDSSNEGAPTAPLSSDPLSARNRLLVTSLPNAGADPQVAGHDPNTWSPLTALAALTPLAAGYSCRLLARR